ncbi:MAG: CDP-glucose 4,6-dehydratase [Bacteroidota bacterium]
MLERLAVYKNKKVLITGNTGFKGSWMTMVLLRLKAQVTGYALEPSTNPSIYHQLGLKNKVKQYLNDIRSLKDIQRCIEETKPDIIFHLAAQPLVHESYKNPVDTMTINTLGTVNLLQAVNKSGISTNVICITSDKCYENQEWLFGYREDDKLGGYDPYSASKAAAEIMIKSFRNSYFKTENYDKHGVKLASVRAGNVIGGGDWSADRIVPDCIKNLERNEAIFVRKPLATRPWQHVLEPVGGYILLGARMFNEKPDVNNFSCAFNFGPLISSNQTVKMLVEGIIKNWGSGEWTHDAKVFAHEASLLNLSIDKAYHLLDWYPTWDFKTTVRNTVEWYKHRFEKGDMVKFTEKQVDEYMKDYSQMLAEL